MIWRKTSPLGRPQVQKSPLIRTLPALIIALGLAFVPPAWARQDKAAAPKPDAPEVTYDTPRQAELLKRQADALAPQAPGVTDVYVIGVAGWAAQSVFRSELDGAIEIIGKALTIKSTVRLINNAETHDAFPLASRMNFAAAVHAVGDVMDKQEDVLVLFMTSHGFRQGFALQLPSTTVMLTPREVAAVLDKEGIRNRVVIVSACFSGIFVKPLANENTILLTAADEKHASFGCADGREWTYFGDALFSQSLKPGGDFKVAYDNARKLIATWEKRDRFTPSNPQGYFGKSLMRKLAPLFAAGNQAQQQ